MGNSMLGFPNRCDSATLTGGSWSSTLPRSNLQNRILGRVARTSDDALASTKFDADLGSSKRIRTIALVNHNFSLDAQFRIRGSEVSNFASTTYDSGWTEVWPVVFPYQVLAWEDETWWTGKYTSEQIEGYIKTLVHTLSINTYARYWRIEIDDTTNPDGYIQIGRFFISPAWQFLKNPSYGASQGWNTKTDIQEAIGGAEYFQRRNPFRSARFTLDFMTEDEAFANAFEIQRRAGINEEVLYIHDPDDTVHALRRQFLGRLRELSTIEYPWPDLNKTAFEIKELI